MQIEQLWVKRDALREMTVHREAVKPLAEGELRVAIERFGLTANNVSYAVSGDVIGYWQYFPAQGDWGIVPVWGFADVVESRCPELPVGERIWGFLPMASHLTLRPEGIEDGRFFDGAAHRRDLPNLYNMYMRTAQDPEMLRSLEDERCLLFPLFATSFILYDYLVAHEMFGAGQVLIGSASSKTGFGLAHLLKNDPKLTQKVVGLTSAGNVDFVRGLVVCDEVVSYADIGALEATTPSAFVDMAGSGPLIEAVHGHFGEQIRESCIVGATHWEDERKAGQVAGARPTFFFAPSHIARRDKEWGRGQAMLRAFAASVQITQAVANQLAIERHQGVDAVGRQWLAMLNNEIPPHRGLILSLL